jgi:hypothetical protein
MGRSFYYLGSDATFLDIYQARDLFQIATGFQCVEQVYQDFLPFTQHGNIKLPKPLHGFNRHR